MLGISGKRLALSALIVLGVLAVPVTAKPITCEHVEQGRDKIAIWAVR